MTEYLTSASIMATRHVDEACEPASRIYLRHTVASRESDGVREGTAGHERGLVLTPGLSHRAQWSTDAGQLHPKVSRARLDSPPGDLLGKPVTKAVELEFAPHGAEYGRTGTYFR